MIKQIENQALWDKFISQNYPHTFLQSWAWGDFNRTLNNKVWRLAVFDQDKLVGVFLTIKEEARRGVFLFVPHGPILKSGPIKSGLNNKGFDQWESKQKFKVLKEITTFLINRASEENCSFIRVSPVFSKTEENEVIFKRLGFAKAPIHIHSEFSWILDLTPPEEILLKKMRKTTRHLLKKNHKPPLEVVMVEDLEGLSSFYRLYQQTIKTKGFVGYDLDYLKAELVAFKNSPRADCRLYLAYHKREPLAAAFVVLYGQSAFYHHGARLRQQTKIPASHILQWTIIKRLKKEGYLFYNFWGIAPKNKPNHPWQGLTIFKRGFGGFEEKYLPSQDYVLKWSYWINWLVETGRRIKRGY